MTPNLIRQMLLGTATAALVGGSIIGSVQAAVRFANVTNGPIVFTMRCAASDETYRWTVSGGRSLDINCNNGASTALVRLYTNDGAVVSRVVSDGDNYQVGYDTDGDATISVGW